MTLAMIGLSHRRAPIEVREKFAKPDAAKLIAATGAREGVVVSTCNRVEVYVAGDDLRPGEVGFGELAYVKRDREAVEHLFRVAAGLDAMVVGETEVIGQVKTAYQAALDAGRTGRVLNPLFQRALKVAKRVHTETRINEGGASVASVAARLAERIFEDLARRRLLVLGAGETGLLTVRSFRHRGLKQIRILNRTVEKAVEAARRFSAEAGGLDEVDARLSEADIVVTCLDVDAPYIDAKRVRAAVGRRGGDPVLIIDLGVPRNVSAEADESDNVYLFDIDDLEGIVSRTMTHRQGELEKALQIVASEVDGFLPSTPSGEVDRLIEALRAKFNSLEDKELEALFDKVEGLTDLQKAQIRLALVELWAHANSGTPPAQARDHVERLLRHTIP